MLSRTAAKVKGSFVPAVDGPIRWAPAPGRFAPSLARYAARAGGRARSSRAIATLDAMATRHAPATWYLLDGRLADDEQVWVELRGRGGELIVGTDRRLIAVERGKPAFEWPWEEVDDVAPVGGRGVIRIRRRDRSAQIDVEPVGDAAEVMQAVTVLALLAVDAARYGARLEELRRGSGGSADATRREG